MSGKKWAITTIAVTLSFLLVLASITFLIDPLYQYRYNDDSGYYLNPRYSCAGLIKTYDYDSVMLGSSITQNFDPDLFKEKMNLDLLKVNIGGMSVPETIYYLEYIDSMDKADVVFMSVDLQRYVLGEDESSFNIPEHLANGYSDDYRYLLSSDVYTRFIPVNLLIKGMDILNIEKPDFITRNTDIDELGSWYYQYEYGEEAFFENFKANGYGISGIESDGVEEKIKNNIDALFSTLSGLDSDTQYNIFFPPYSSMYWVYIKESSQFDTFMKAKEYIFELSEKYENVAVYDFQNFDVTTDLSYYRDVSHYSKDVNDYMVNCFADKHFLVESEETVRLNSQGISQKSDMFREKYKEQIEKYGQIKK